MNINPNDPAFPQSAWNDGSGLTIRTELAARVMQGIISNPGLHFSALGFIDVAQISTNYADALIVVLNKEKL